VQPRKVLIIDDSTLIHKLFRFTLPDRCLVFAANGVEALSRLSENPDVDLIFLDINMPRMNGLELLARLKADQALAGIPVIVISTEGKEHDVVRGLQAGAAGYVRKPFGSVEITAMMARLPASGGGDQAGDQPVSLVRSTS
jgi:CheY-like chemotaxis protein